MNLSNLKYVVEVEKTGSITRAAQNFFMNQPHLSRILRELEKDLGFQIFERTGRGMVPTQKGEQFLQYAKVILTQEEQIEALRQNFDAKALTVRLAAPRTSYLPLALALLAEEAEGKAPLKISFRETNPRQVIRNVAGKDFDLGTLPAFLSENASGRKSGKPAALDLLLPGRIFPLPSSGSAGKSDLPGFKAIYTDLLWRRSSS